MPDIRIHGVVTHGKTSEPIENALVELFRKDAGEGLARITTHTTASGRFNFEVQLDRDVLYCVQATAFGVPSEPPRDLNLRGEQHDVTLNIELQLGLAFSDYQRDTGKRTPVPYAAVGQEVFLTVESQGKIRDYIWPRDPAMRVVPLEGERQTAVVTFRTPGAIPVSVAITGDDDAKTRVSAPFAVAEATRSIRFAGSRSVDGQETSGRLQVTMDRTESHPTPDKILWEAIRDRSEASSFGRYKDYIYRVLQPQTDDFLSGGLSRKLGELGARGFGAYHTLREFTELFVLSESSSIEPDVVFDQNADLNIRPRRPLSSRIEEELRHYLVHGELPYIERVLKAAYPRLGWRRRAREPPKPSAPKAVVPRALARNVSRARNGHADDGGHLRAVPEHLYPRRE